MGNDVGQSHRLNYFYYFAINDIACISISEPYARSGGLFELMTSFVTRAYNETRIPVYVLQVSFAPTVGSLPPLRPGICNRIELP